MSESFPYLLEGIAKVLTVRLGANLHAVPIVRVEEVLPALPIEWIPQCPDYVRGVVFVRGHFVPVIDAAKRLGLKNHQRAGDPNIVCVRQGERIVGVEFDEALDLIDVGEVEAWNEDFAGTTERYVIGVIEHEGRTIRLLDPDIFDFDQVDG